VKIVKREVELINPVDYETALNTVEQAGRNCYHSYDKMAEGSAEKLIRMFVKVNHGSPLEFVDVTMRIIADRALLGQISRHRLASFCVASQRYINYTKETNGSHVPFIEPIDMTEKGYPLWFNACLKAEDTYKKLLSTGCKPETARSVLPNCTATEIVMKANIREWRHILTLRLGSRTQHDFRDIAGMMLELLYEKYPVFFEDLAEKYLNE